MNPRFCDRRQVFPAAQPLMFILLLYCIDIDALSSFSQASLLYIFRVAYAICLLFFLYRIFLQYNKILNELHSPLKSYEYTYHTTSLFFHIYSKGPTGISILYYGYVYDQKFVETKSFLKNVFLRLLFGESNSPRFYHFCVRQFMEAARFGHHSLLFAFFVYFLAFFPALGMQLKRNTHIKSEKRTQMNCRTKKL